MWPAYVFSLDCEAYSMSFTLFGLNFLLLCSLHVIFIWIKNCGSFCLVFISSAPRVCEESCVVVSFSVSLCGVEKVSEESRHLLCSSETARTALLVS